MKTKRVTVCPYDASWKAEFEKIRAEIESAVGEHVIGIEHVGSTAVEGLCAKPCIDLDVIIKDATVLPFVIEGLRKIGYFHEGDLGIRDREAFGYSGKEHLYKHHLYVCPESSEELLRHITFRDYLRAHPDAAAEYGAVKTEAARLFPCDIDGYIEYKSSCINEIYKRCGLK